MSKRQGEDPEHTARSLETRELGPLAVQHLREVRVERVATQEPLLRLRTQAPRLLVHVGDALQRGDDVRSEGVPAGNRLGGEEPPPQHLGYVFLDDRLDGFFPLTLEDRVKIAQQLASRGVALRRIGGKQGCDDAAAVHLRGGLGQILEEVHKAVAPLRILRDLLARVHQYLVDQNEHSDARLHWDLQQLGEKILCGGAFPLFGFVLGVQQLEAGVAGDLVRKHAPRLLEHPDRPVRSNDLHPLLDVELVETEGRNHRLDGSLADLLDKFLDGRQIRKAVRVVHEVAQGDERVRLAAAIGQL